MARDRHPQPLEAVRRISGRLRLLLGRHARQRCATMRRRRRQLTRGRRSRRSIRGHSALWGQAARACGHECDLVEVIAHFHGCSGAWGKPQGEEPRRGGLCKAAEGDEG